MTGVDADGRMRNWLENEVQVESSVKVLKNWLEDEVQARLVDIDRKLDKLVAMPAGFNMSHCTDMIKPASSTDYYETPSARHTTFSELPTCASRRGWSKTSDDSSKTTLSIPVDQPRHSAWKTCRTPDPIRVYDEDDSEPMGHTTRCHCQPPATREFVPATLHSEQLLRGTSETSGRLGASYPSGIIELKAPPSEHSEDEVFQTRSGFTSHKSLRSNRTAQSSLNLECGSANVGLRRGQTGRLGVRPTSDGVFDCTQFQNVNNLMDRRFRTLWIFLDYPDSGKFAKWYGDCMQVFVFITVVTPFLQLSDEPQIAGIFAAVLETFFDSVFCIEYSLRLMACPNKLTFLRNRCDIIDGFSFAILACRAYAGFVLDDYEGVLKSFLLCGVATLRFMKTMRAFTKFELILTALQSVWEALPVLLWTLAMSTLLFASLIYTVEPRDNVESFKVAVWLTIVTMTTVGYGDVTPVTNAGLAITSCLIFCSVLYMAMPLGIIGEAFSTVWTDRENILLISKLRKRLMQYGYSADDIQDIFVTFDADGTGVLEFTEFKDMVNEMGIGLSEDRIVSLFDTIDCDGGGAVDDKEFIRHIFPSAFHHMFELDDAQVRKGRRKSGGYRRKSVVLSGAKSELTGTTSAESSPMNRHKDVMWSTTANIENEDDDHQEQAFDGIHPHAERQASLETVETVIPPNAVE